MRIVCCSDAHLDARTAGVERFDEIRESFDQAKRFAIEETPKADLFAFTGDLCDPEDGRDVLRASSYALGVALELKAHRVPSLWVGGNHDPCGDGQTTTLEPLFAAQQYSDGFVIVSSRVGFWFRHGFAPNACVILALPYSPSPYDAEAMMLEAGKTARNEGVPLLVFAHLMLPGMHPGSESQEMARGKDRMFPIEAMRKAKPALVVNGHYHEAQTTPDGIRIPGSLARLTFGEEKHEPGFLVVDL